MVVRSERMPVHVAAVPVGRDNPPMTPPHQGLSEIPARHAARSGSVAVCLDRVGP